MKLATIRIGDRETIGVVEGDHVFDIVACVSRDVPASMPALLAAGAPVLDAIREAISQNPAGTSAAWQRLEDVVLCAPITRPGKNVFCIGRNYKAHIEEGCRAKGIEVFFPPAPEIFTKPPTAVAGHDDEFVLDPEVTGKLDYEGELAIVIGRRCRDVPLEAYDQVVAGYTIVNDISARDLQVAHLQFFKGKALDGSCPIGPWIVTADEFGDPGAKQIVTRVNGEVRQDGSTSDMLFDCREIVASLSRGLTLEPGDIIATGTPSGVGAAMTPPRWLGDGDVVEIGITGIGSLRTRIVERRQAPLF